MDEKSVPPSCILIVCLSTARTQNWQGNERSELGRAGICPLTAHTHSYTYTHTCEPRATFSPFVSISILSLSYSPPVLLFLSHSLAVSLYFSPPPLSPTSLLLFLSQTFSLWVCFYLWSSLLFPFLPSLFTFLSLSC